MLEALEILKPHATIISALSALVSAVAVVISTWFIIWITYFRKTRRDRIDELKEEMQVKLSQGWTQQIIKTHDMDRFLRSLDKKFHKSAYKRLYQCAYNELAYEGKNEVIEYHKASGEHKRWVSEMNEWRRNAKRNRR